MGNQQPSPNSKELNNLSFIDILQWNTSIQLRERKINVKYLPPVKIIRALCCVVFNCNTGKIFYKENNVIKKNKISLQYLKLTN